MYAVIESGGKQYRVELGTEFAVDRLGSEAGETLALQRVLLVADGDETAVGRPLVEGARVSAAVVRQERGEKLVVFKYRPKARRRVKHGHRQERTVLRIADIEWAGRSAAREAEAARTERERLDAARAAAAEKAAADQELARKLAREADSESGTDAEAAPASRAPRIARPSVRRSRPGAADAKTGDAKAGDAKTADAKGPSSRTGRSRSPADRTQAPPPAPADRPPRRTRKKDE